MLPFYQVCCLFRSLHFRNMFQDVQRRFCADSNSEKSDPKFPSGQPNHAFGRPSVMRPDVMATRPAAHQSSRSFQISFVGTYMGRQHSLVRTTRQYRPNAEILDKEIAWRSSATVRMSGQYCPDAVLIMKVMCSRFTTVQMLGQHRPNAALIWRA
jgi:hypothetical protein